MQFQLQLIDVQACAADVAAIERAPLTAFEGEGVWGGGDLHDGVFGEQLNFLRGRTRVAGELLDDLFIGDESSVGVVTVTVVAEAVAVRWVRGVEGCRSAPVGECQLKSFEDERELLDLDEEAFVATEGAVLQLLSEVLLDD